MSTDSAPPGSLVGFRRALWTLIGAATLLCLGLVAANLLSGPRLTGFEIDTVGVVAQANQRLVLDTNRQLADVDLSQVTITPATAITVRANADTVVINFPQPLAYETDYRITVSGVGGIGNAPNSDISVNFRTGEPKLYYLSRTPVDPDTPERKNPDRIVQTAIGSAQGNDVFSAPYIQQFVPIGKELAVVTVKDDLSNSLSIVDPDGRAEPLTLPGVGTVDDLQAAPNQSLLGFRFTSAEGAPGPRYENALFVLRLATAVAEPVNGLGSAVKTTEWGFLPGRADLVARQYDGSLLLIDPLSEADPLPLGQFSGLTAFAPDGVRIAVSDEVSQYILDLSQGTEEAIAPETVAETTPYTAGLKFLAGGTGFVQRLAEFDPETGVAGHYLEVVVDGVRREIYRPASASESIVDFAVSPNDQYVAVQIEPNTETSTSDRYPARAQATDATTLFVNIATGRMTRSVLGFDVTWPR